MARGQRPEPPGETGRKLHGEHHGRLGHWYSPGMLLRGVHVSPGLAGRDAIPAGQRAQHGCRRESSQQAERSIDPFGVLGKPCAPPIVHVS